MLQDPLYQAIEDALGETLDPQVFERCAVELLRPAYPGLSPVRGGGDAGMDGSMPTTDAPPLPLICTTGTDVIGNLTRSLKSYLAKGGESRFAVLATSQALTPERRRNLQQRAREFGFTLRNIHARDDLVGRLYQAPKWRKELLGLTGEPPALSAVPRTRRPMSAHPLIGREKEVAWLKSQEGDCLLIGQPGSGKTAILASLALAGEGAFVVSDVRAEIADAIREQSPRRVFVDDAQRHQDLLLELLALREELGADFSLAATCWPAESEETQRSLGLTSDAARRLPLLPRPEVAEIVKAVGIGGPEGLVAEIVDQAGGLPGLAVTLAQLSIRGGTAGLASGDFLLRDFRGTLRELVGEHAIPILAAFSVGGRFGFGLDDVAQALAVPAAEVWHTVTRIESGGVLRQLDRGALAVEPPALREALVREVFFDGPKSLSIADLLANTPSPASTAETLMRSRGRGAEIPDELIQDLLVKCIPEERWWGEEKNRAWRLYAYTGAASVDWILDRYPHLLEVVVRPALIHRPRRVIPILLEAAIEDERPLPPNPGHPLRLIQDWIEAGRPGTDEALSRRRELLDAVRGWVSQPGAVPRVARKALAISFSAEYKVSPVDPIDPRQIRISSGRLMEDEFRELHGWWPEAVEVLESVGVDDVRDLEHTVRQWAFPGMLHVEPSEGVASAAKAGAVQMLEDIARLGAEFPGVLSWASRIADRAGLDIHLPADIDPIYRVLFPREDFTGDWKARFEQQHEEARELGATWANEAPEDVAAMLVGYDREASRVERSWPRLTDVAASALAEQVDQPLRWIDALVEEGAQPDLVAPLLGRLLEQGGEDAEAVWNRLFDTGNYRPLCLDLGLRAAGTTEAMLERTLSNLDGAEQLVQVACLRDEVPIERLARLLQHPSPGVSAAAAEGVWHTRRAGGNIPSELRRAWRTSVIRHGRAEHMLQEVFREDPDMAKEWLLARRGEDVLSRSREGDTFSHAVAVLESATRRELLGMLDADFGPPGFFGRLVGRDPDLFDLLLERPDLLRVHLEPLEGRPDSSWIELAKRALDAGYSTEDIVVAVHGSVWSWRGKESSMWEGWVEAFRALEEHEEGRIREIGRIGRGQSESRAASAREREREEEVYGF